MLLNGSIRRKMWINLALVVGMLIALSVGALTGLNSYRRLVRELDYSIHDAPRRADLADAVKSLYAPLLRPFPEDANDDLRKDRAAQQRRDFEARLASTQRRVADFHRRLDQLAPSETSSSRREKTVRLLEQIESRLGQLGAPENVRQISELWERNDLEDRKTAMREMLQQVAAMDQLAEQVPNFHSGLLDSLERAKGIYLSRLRLVGWMSAIVILLFIGFGYYVYAGILAPIRQLHQGATRVAEGDLQYQLDLPNRGELTDLAGAFNRMTARFQDIRADLKRQVGEQTRQAMRSARLANIGFLAAGVAHEINNPLNAISMAAEALERYAPPGDGTTPQEKQGEKYRAMIRRESKRCQEITRRLLDFARGDDGTRTRVNLTHLINEVLDMVRPMSPVFGSNKGSNRTIEFFRTEPCIAEVNGPEIKQVVLNIVSNGLESLNDDGVLRIRIAEQTDAVELIFEDNGCGMTEEVLEHLFEPFFTRRKDGRGTGLGMAICQRIVSDHHGALEAESAGERQGSTFRVKLPRRAESKREAA